MVHTGGISGPLYTRYPEGKKSGLPGCGFLPVSTGTPHTQPHA